MNPTAVAISNERYIVADGFKNLMIFHRDEKLERVADFHIGITIYGITKFEKILIIPSMEGAIGCLF